MRTVTAGSMISACLKYLGSGCCVICQAFMMRQELSVAAAGSFFEVGALKP